MTNPIWQQFVSLLANERFDNVIDFLVQSGFYDESKVSELLMMKGQWKKYWSEYNTGLIDMPRWFSIQNQLGVNLNQWFENIPATYYFKS
jgi:hypothetical protein